MEQKMFDDVREGFMVDTGHFLIKVERPLPESKKLGVTFCSQMSAVAMPDEMRRIAKALTFISEKLEDLSAQHIRH